MTHQAHYNTKLANDRDLAILEARNDQATLNIRRYEAFRQSLAICLAFIAGVCVATCAYHFISLL